jgi:hypothetical protein
LRQTSTGETVDVIVQYRDNPTSVHHQRVLDRGGELKGELTVSARRIIRFQRASLRRFPNDPDVEYISPDRVVTGTSNTLYTGSTDYGWR